ncbi:Spo0E family sporulation regulatory protein-aspartic acid phosphatase [Clostridium sp.]
MNSLRELEKLREELEELIKIKGIEDSEVLNLSQKLDIYIVQFYIK